MLAELYPTAVRASGQGFTYSTGRGLGALAPYVVGTLADRFGLGASLAINSAFFLDWRDSYLESAGDRGRGDDLGGVQVTDSGGSFSSCSSVVYRPSRR